MLKHRWRVLFIDTQYPTSAFLAHIALRIRITDHWMLWIAILAPLLQGRINVCDNELMLHRDRWDLDP